MRRFLWLFIFFALVKISYSQEFLPDTLRSCNGDSVLLKSVIEGVTIDTWAMGNVTNVIAEDTSQIWADTYAWYYAYGEADLMTPHWDSTLVMILDVGIATPDTTIECGDTITVAGNAAGYSYLWMPGDLTGQEVAIFPRDTTAYVAQIINTSNPVEYCYDTLLITVEPVIVVDTLIQTEKACPDVKEAAVDIDLSGGFPPYHYSWQEGYPYFQDSSILLNVADGNYVVSITDSLGCRLNYPFEVKAWELPEIEIETEPGDTIYFTKPFIDIAYTNLSGDTSSNPQYQINSFFWDLGDGTTEDQEAFSYEYKVEDPLAEEPQTFNLKFSYNTFYGCPGKDSTTIILKPVKMLVANVLSPNGDDKNQFFKVELDGASGHEEDMFVNDFYLRSELYVVNRWGNVVYEDKDYKNDWEGSNLSNGTYYYILKCWGKNTEKGRPHVYRGVLHIFR